MQSDVRAKLIEALGKVDRPGSFCVSGSVPAVLPGLEVDPLGPIGLPLNAKQAGELKKQCQQAPYGKGEATVVDTNVRRVWRMAPERFSLTNPDWDRFLKETVARVQDALGLKKQTLEAHLHDLLLYEPGGFFLPHRDGEKLDRMVATLVVVLPSTYEGGELVVRHDGREKTIDFSADPGSAYQTRYVAFYADCEHEVRPLRSGHRLCLVYNLTLARSRSGTTIKAPRTSEHVENVRALLRQWADDDDSERKLVVTLGHQYTKGGLAWDALKGEDRARAQVLVDAARQEGCRAYLALLTFHESGEAEEVETRRSRRGYWGYGDADDASAYRMGEIYESSLIAEHLVDGEGDGLPIGKLNVAREELLDPDALKGFDPEVEFGGYTGNEGMTLDHWYRHAAVVLWPEGRHFEILCDRDGRNIVPVLTQMVAQCPPSKPRTKAKNKEAEALKAQCLDLARAILDKWSAVRSQWGPPEAPGGNELFAALNALDAPGLIGRFLGEVMVKDVSVDPGTAIVSTCQTYGWGTFREPLRTLMADTTRVSLARNVRMLENLCSAKARNVEGWKDLCADLAQAFVAALEAIHPQPASFDYGVEKLDRAALLAGLVRSLIATGQFDLLSRVVAHVQASPKAFPMRAVQIPALLSLQPWLKTHLKTPCAAFTRWAASCREQLESLTAKAPVEPADYRRRAAISCKCENCAELKRFLEDPRESVHRFSQRQDRRDHLQRQIVEGRCDLTCKTERTGSPHTLVCAKTTASYQEALKTYLQDEERLLAVRSIEASLPEG